MPLHLLPFPFQVERPYPFYSPATAEQAAAIFVHIPKTGGTSIRKVLNLPPPNKKQGLFKHFSAAVIVDHFPFELWQNAFKFAFVRHPFTRLYSHYQYRKREGRILRRYGKELSFSEWVQIALDRERAGNLQPQHQWVYDQDGQLLVDFVGRYERLDEDFGQVQQQLKMSSTSLPYLNQSPKPPPYHQLYDAPTQQKAVEFYAEDFAHFGYSTDLNQL